MAAIVATRANAQNLPPERRGAPKFTAPGKPIRSIKDVAGWARRVPNYIENSGTENRYITGYIRAVRQYALNAQRGNSQGMAKVLEALTKINADTERLNRPIDTIEKTAGTLSTKLSSSAADFAAAWREFRATTGSAAAPNTRSNGTSSPGVPGVELREDREAIVKVGPNREQIREIPSKELVERVERQQTMIARQKNMTALERCSFIPARILPSGDVAMVKKNAAGADLRKNAGWLKTFGPIAVVQQPSGGVVAYHIPVKLMKITPESVADVATDLLRNSIDHQIHVFLWLV